MTLTTYAGLACATIIFVWSPIFAWARARWYEPSRQTRGTKWNTLAWLDAKRSELFGCAMCLGTQLGIAWSLTSALLAGRRDIWLLLGSAILDGAIVGVLAWIIYLLGRVLDEYESPRSSG